MSKAQELADKLNSLCVAEFAWRHLNDAATELRRLDRVNAEQRKLLDELRRLADELQSIADYSEFDALEMKRIARAALSSSGGNES